MNAQLKVDPAALIAAGRRALEIEGRAISALVPRLDSGFARACSICLECHGRVIVSGMGKSGHVAGKIAATLASTGTPSFFIHAAEASHGDIGMITRDDVLLAISNSGETAEVLLLIPHLSRLGVPIIAMTGNAKSNLARAATVHLDVSVEEEACPLNLAPTASTTATLALGDALAVALLEARGFTSQDFARSHPGGALGRKLLLHVADVMRTGEDLPSHRAIGIARRRPVGDVEKRPRHVRRGRCRTHARVCSPTVICGVCSIARSMSTRPPCAK